MNEKPLKIIKILNLLFALAVIAVNALANILPINGKNTGELSDNIPNLFVPAGLTFSIWGVIYFFFVVFVLYQFIGRSKEQSEKEFVSKIGIWFIINSIFNIAWILLWHYELVELSLVVMLVILITLIIIYLRLKIDRRNTPTDWKQVFGENFLFSIYLGWISVATVANVTAVLVVNNWNGWGISESMWTIIMLIIVIILTGLMLFLRGDWAYAAVIEWAILGIYLKRSDPALEPQTGIVVTSIIGMILIGIGIIVYLIKSLKK